MYLVRNNISQAYLLVPVLAPLRLDRHLLRIQIMIMLKLKSKKWTIETPIYFIAFLAEVINKALIYKENSDINIFEIICEAAGKRMGLSVNAEQLKSLI